MSRPAISASKADPLRLSIPGRGHVLTSIAETYGKPIRQAVAEIAASLDRQKSAVGSQVPETTECHRAPNSGYRRRGEMAAWHLCTRWVVGNALGALDVSSSLADASSWFAGTNAIEPSVASERLEERSLAGPLAALQSVATPGALAELLPYILDPHGPGSRLSVRRDPATSAARAQKRTHGVFYTPADVADYMTGLALNHLAPCHPVTMLDPACGTGVYLRAALAALVARHPAADPLTLAEHSLFGVDIDPWAVDAAAYVLLHDVLARRAGSPLAPAVVWQLLRLNLRVADALQLDPVSERTDAALKEADRDRRHALRCGETPNGSLIPPLRGRTPIDHLFPGIGPGPRIVLGNPPYAEVGTRPDLPALAARFETLRPAGTSADLHPLFLEQMVRLSAPESSGALVLPLSIAFNSRPQYTALRRLIERTPGAWRFSFFDREPHALFGEDVKTRNTIVAWSRASADAGARIMTGPLLKWRGGGRARMFESIRFTEVEPAIADVIPKLNGARQALALKTLEKAHAQARLPRHTVETAELADCFDADDCTVFVGSTAYNFLNVFMKPTARLKPAGALSTNTIYALRCPSPQEARALFAALSSRVAFWLWHTLGDGFHVTRKFLEDAPLSAAQAAQRAILAELGEILWRDVRSQPILSCNRGRQSLGFSAARSPELQRRIDQVLLDVAALPASFASDLDQFIQSVVAANPCEAVETASPKDSDA